MNKPSLNERAIRYLAQRDHSRAELAYKLSAYGSAEEIKATLERMIELGLQSDERFASAWVRNKAPRFGNARLYNDLIQRGVSREIVSHVLATENDQTETEHARIIWNKKFGCPPKNTQEWAKQARFLQSRGFSTETIRQLLKDCHNELA